MVSTTDFDSVSLGSSPSSPTNLTNMEEIEKINIINKRLRQKEARAKRDIQEGIQEYESRDNLSCSSCIFYDKGFCEKGLLMTAQNIGIKVWTSILMEV